MQSADPLGTTAELLCELLEALIHQILFLRRIYDREIFERERLYGLAVQKCRHPELAVYIADAVLSLKAAISSGRVSSFAVKLEDDTGCLKERYVVSIKLGSSQSGTIDSGRLESACQAVLLKLQYADACMKPLPEGCTFVLEVETAESSAVASDTWVEADAVDDSQSSDRQRTIVPIKSAAFGQALSLQLHAEIM